MRSSVQPTYEESVAPSSAIITSAVKAIRPSAEVITLE